MRRLDDPDYLRKDQYRDSTKLNSRVNLHARFSVNPRGWYPWLAAQLDLPSTTRLLEVGCGPGLLWVSQPASLPPSPVLSDFSPGMLSAARQSLHPGRPDIHFALLNLSSLPFHSECFDVVIANHMLYHVPNRVQALANIRSVLRPGGKLYAATNGQHHLAELYARVAQAFDLDNGEEIRLSHSGTLSFNLENGEDQLRSNFNKVELRRYQDALAITAVDPLLEYTLSMMGDLPSLFDKHGVRKLRDLWQKELQENGVIHISKDTGLFIAS